jgi:hypothetical protein
MMFVGIKLDAAQWEEVHNEIAKLGLINWNEKTFEEKQEWVGRRINNETFK